MAVVGTIVTFSNGSVLNAPDLNNNFTAVTAAINDNDANIASINSVVQQAGFTPSSAYNYFQTQFATTNKNVTTLTATVTALSATVTTLSATVAQNSSNENALYWMGAI